MTQEQISDLQDIRTHLNIWIKFHGELRDRTSDQSDKAYHARQVDKMFNWADTLTKLING